MFSSCENIDNFDHVVTQVGPGERPQSKSDIKSKVDVPLLRLNNGVYMPRFGFGTQIQAMQSGSIQMVNAKVDETVIAALTSGFTHLDTAHAYLNEKGVGYGIIRSKVVTKNI